jgi:hypothetical protein
LVSRPRRPGSPARPFQKEAIGAAVRIVALHAASLSDPRVMLTLGEVAAFVALKASGRGFLQKKLRERSGVVVVAQQAFVDRDGTVNVPRLAENFPMASHT